MDVLQLPSTDTDSINKNDNINEREAVTSYAAVIVVSGESGGNDLQAPHLLRIYTLPLRRKPSTMSATTAENWHDQIYLGTRPLA